MTPLRQIDRIRIAYESGATTMPEAARLSGLPLNVTRARTSELVRMGGLRIVGAIPRSGYRPMRVYGVGRGVGEIES